MTGCIWCGRPGYLRVTAEDNVCEDGSPGDPVYACDDCWEPWWRLASKVKHAVEGRR